MDAFNELSEELQKLFDLSRQYWFFGAGVSFASSVPLMAPLTRKISVELTGGSKVLYDAISAELAPGSHVEHVLSQIGDFIALARRTTARKIKLGNVDVDLAQLDNLYAEVLGQIGRLVRYGYVEGAGGAPEEIGSLEKPIVVVNHHVRFVEALLRSRANLEERTSLTFFTSNYDTLLEDALSLRHQIPIDGFSGGAMGFWDPHTLDRDKGLSARHCRVFKLHGSVDWFNDPEYGLVRCRYGVNYLADMKNLLIYPRATKYIETQRDPFAVLFSGLRNALKVQEDHAFFFCGYSFGDDHINAEIELAMKEAHSRTTLVIFVQEDVDPANMANSKIKPVLEKWLSDPTIGVRIYVASDRALYKGAIRAVPTAIGNLNWWSFAGLTDFLTHRSL